MSATCNYFDHLPDELVEKIFVCFSNTPTLQPYNHVRSPPNLFYFDYSLQQPSLKENHKHLLRLTQVCRRFYRIIKSPEFWERKCRTEHIIQPDDHFPKEFEDFEKLYVYNPFHQCFNFIDENRWQKDPYSSTRLELCPVGTARLYDEFDRLIPCRATSYMTASYYQMDIPLYNEKLAAPHIGRLRPIIEFSICISPRWDCGAFCSIDLVFSNGYRWNHRRDFPQWTDRKWHRLIFRYDKYDELPLSVSLRLRGSDSQFWEGYYGIKFAQMRLRFVLNSNEEVRRQEEIVIEPKIDDNVPPPPSPSEVDDPTLEASECDRFDHIFDISNTEQAFDNDFDEGEM